MQVRQSTTGTSREPAGGLRRWRCLRLAVALALVALVVGGALSSPAAAHTRLVETVPANRTIAAETPERLTLVFAEAVDPRTVQLEVIALGGEIVGGARLLTATGADATVVEFALPPLADGVFGLSWVTVGPDGHRVAGEVVLGVGVVDGEAVAASGFARVSPLDRTLEVLNGVGRYLWYLGLALVAGALLALSWRLRAGSARSVAAAVLTADARRALTAGALVLHAAIVLRTGATVTLVTRGYGDGSLREHLRLALVDGTGRTLLLAVVGHGGAGGVGAPPRPGSLGVGAAAGRPRRPGPRGLRRQPGTHGDAVGGPVRDLGRHAARGGCERLAGAAADRRVDHRLAGVAGAPRARARGSR